jgi:hypothetical protein
MMQKLGQVLLVHSTRHHPTLCTNGDKHSTPPAMEIFKLLMEIFLAKKLNVRLVEWLIHACCLARMKP